MKRCKKPWKNEDTGTVIKSKKGGFTAVVISTRKNNAWCPELLLVEEGVDIVGATPAYHLETVYGLMDMFEEYKVLKGKKLKIGRR